MTTAGDQGRVEGRRGRDVGVFFKGVCRARDEGAESALYGSVSHSIKVTRILDKLEFG